MPLTSAPPATPTVPAADVQSVRSHFPALERRVGGHPVAYLDGSGGTQVAIGGLRRKGNIRRNVIGRAHV